MGDTRLINDVAAEVAREAVSLFNWDREEQMVEAYHALLAVVRDGLERYRERKRRELLRLARPGGDEN